MLDVLALVAVGLVARAMSSRAPAVETGAKRIPSRDWRADIERANARQAKKDGPRRKRPSGVPAKRRPSADCCTAESDHWRTSRAVYDRWRAPDPLEYRAALHACWLESVEAAANGDYSKPASRRCALGKQHANKLAQWKQCREGCARAGLGVDPLLEAVASEGVFERWLAEDGSGGVVWARYGVSDLARVSPDGGGWRVDFQSGGRGPWKLIEQTDDEAAADDYARELLDLPF